MKLKRTPASDNLEPLDGGAAHAVAPPARPPRPARHGRPPGRRRIVAGGVVGALVLAAAGVGTAHALQSSPDAAYRTAVVTTSSVTQTLERSGTIEPVAQASVSFPMSGTVATVPVTAGAAVTTGEVLATLDTTSLEAALTARQATLAAAQLTVSQAVTAASTVTVSSTKTAGSASSSTSAASGSGRSTSGQSATGTAASGVSTSTSATTPAGSQTQVNASVLQEATAVTTDQTMVDATLSQATAVVRAATQVCTLASGTSPASAAGDATACAAAEQSALTVQQQLATAEANLATAEATFQGALSSTGSPTTSTTAAPTAASGSSAHITADRTGPASTAVLLADLTSAGATGSSTGGLGGSGSASAVPTAADLVADQAAVDAAQADVTAAQQNLAQATIVSPINGTVAAVGLSVGASVSAQSSTENVVVVGNGGWEVATTIPVAAISDVKVGDGATVQPDGQSQALDGTVVQIGVAATTSGTTTSYPVIVGFSSNPAGLGNGASATVTISTAQAAQVLTVPTSAVHAAGGFHYVTTLANGKVTNAAVQIGAMGGDRTAIDSGLQAGQVVVLADLNAALPSSNTASKTGLAGATGLAGPGTVVRVSGVAGRGGGGG